MSLDTLLQPEHVASFLTLFLLEIVLAGDNLVLIAILSGRLPEGQRHLARRFGLLAAVATRLLLLLSLFWLSHLETPIPLNEFGLTGMVITPRQIVFAIGGMFLLLKSLSEIASFFEENSRTGRARSVQAASGILLFTIVQIAIFDIIFSLDSVIAAIGIARDVEVMVAAIVAASLVMFFLVNPISNFIERYPTIKLIALNFLALVGVFLIVEALNIRVEHIDYYLGLVVVVIVQLTAYWYMRQSRIVRMLASLLLLSTTAAFAVGFYHHGSGQQSPFNDFYSTTMAAVERMHSAAKSGLNWIDPKVSSDVNPPPEKRNLRAATDRS